MEENELLLDGTHNVDDVLRLIRLNLPEEPGVYKYRDRDGKLIYVGKARNIRKRVNSYFTKNTSHDYKTRALVRNICSIEYVVTWDENEALILENNLIKENQPKYNIQLRDGKSYPYICIKQEPFPRVFATRKKIEDGSLYYGPYPSGSSMHSILKFIRSNFKLRTCTLALTDRNIQAGKFRPCLEYQIGKCKAPCVGWQAREAYDRDIQQIKHILAGNFDKVLADLEYQMQQAATSLQFEQAQHIKQRMDRLEQYRRKNTIVSRHLTNLEVLALQSRENLCIATHFKIHRGTVIQTHAFDIWFKTETPTDIFGAVVSRLAAEDPQFSRSLLTNLEPNSTLSEVLPEDFQPRTPHTEEERKLLALAERNGDVLLSEKLNLKMKYREEAQYIKVLRQLQEDLKLPEVPYHIEGFDNSNIQGYAPVSSVVVFRNGKPAKRDYRVMNVRNVEGPDDFATMKEVVHRRYRRMLEEGQSLPDLILIDGGKGQLSHALEALAELDLADKLPVIGIAKRLEEIYYKYDPVPLYLDKKSPSLQLLQRIRNEAHKTAINYHRRKRDEKTLHTELTHIKGVGQATAQTLLAHFKSVDFIRQQPETELAKVIGPAKASLVWNHYHPSPESSAIRDNQTAHSPATS